MVLLAAWLCVPPRRRPGAPRAHQGLTDWGRRGGQCGSPGASLGTRAAACCWERCISLSGRDRCGGEVNPVERMVGVQGGVIRGDLDVKPRRLQCTVDRALVGPCRGCPNCPSGANFWKDVWAVRRHRGVQELYAGKCRHRQKYLSGANVWADRWTGLSNCPRSPARKVSWSQMSLVKGRVNWSGLTNYPVSRTKKALK